MMLVSAFAVLLSGFGSVVDVVTTATFSRLAPGCTSASTVAVTVKTAVVSALRLAAEQVTTPSLSLQPLVASTKVTPAGSVSTSESALAVLGPRLRTVSV